MIHTNQPQINHPVAEQNDCIRRLIMAEQRIVARLGDERVAELRAFWQKSLPPAAEDSFKQKMGQDDKKLTWIWFRLKRALHSLENRKKRKHRFCQQ